MIEVDFLGAAQTVTGSMHLVRAPSANVLLDCGLFQGRRQEANEINRSLRVDPKDVHAVVLSHAHIDHSGALPLLYKRGFRGNVFTTNATMDLCHAMLEDSALIQEADARYINKVIERDGVEMRPVQPLYTVDDVDGVLRLMNGIAYHKRVSVAPGIDATFLDAGHVLGSAIVVLDIDDVGTNRRLVFTGDLGRKNMPILRDPEVPSGADMLIMESTYGDRLHDDIELMDARLAEIVERTTKRGGKVLIPSFALERAQEVIYALGRCRRKGRLLDIPVVVDSPLTIKLTEVFRRHPDCYDDAASQLLKADETSLFDFDGLRYITSVEDSKALSRSDEPCVVIAASGMCEFGRIVHHLRAAIGDRRHTICIVGFQAQHTLGRRLVEGRTRVRIFGVEQERLAEVAVLNGFSAHADQRDLIEFAEAMRDSGPLRHIALVHGEPQAQKVLQQALFDRGFPSVHIPEPKERLRF